MLTIREVWKSAAIDPGEVSLCTRMVLLATLFLAGCAAPQAMVWVKSDGSRLDKSQALLRQLDQAKAVCGRQKTEISGRGAGASSPVAGARPSAIVSTPMDTDAADAFRKGDTIDKSIQAGLIFDACMRERGFRKSPMPGR